ncbi:MAG: hypothetical protein DRI86_01830 [Bacteroidetes bacterium]|nr:MAG: hypothetical protein DRI86_01830 [Bacteroidota bacterium]
MNSTKNILLGLFLVIFSQVLIGQNTISDIKIFAERNLQSVLEKIPINDEISFGFNSREEFKQTELGEPLEFIWYSETKDNSNKTWRVPIVVNGEYRALLNVQNIGNEFKVADFGASVLAEDIQKTMNENKGKNVSGVLRLTAITSDFLIVRNAVKEEYLPLTSAKMFINSRNMELQKTYSPSDLIELLNKR